MKKMLAIVVVLFAASYLFAQSNSVVERIQKGDLALLNTESDITDFDLACMDNSELRLLRNMIYANSEFTEKEQLLIKRIQRFESRNENLPTLKFGNEIIGLWHASPIMPATWCDRFLIYPDSRIEFISDYFDQNPTEYLGNYDIKGNVLIFYVNKIVKKEKVESLDTSLIFRFPISDIQEVTFEKVKLVRKMIQIGGYEYFLYDDNTETMGKWARTY